MKLAVWPDHAMEGRDAGPRNGCGLEVHLSVQMTRRGRGRVGRESAAATEIIDCSPWRRK